MSNPARILIVIPCLNEAPHLRALLDTLRADPRAGEARIVVVDGGSTDGSQDIVRDIAQSDPRVELLHNPKRIQSAAVNLAVRQNPGAAYLVRVDAHARYPADYVSRLVAACESEGVDAVTVSMRAETSSNSCFQRANATAQNSVLGAGGSPHRNAGVRRLVDHGHHALFRMSVFTRAGGYNEDFTHNEDAELDARISAQGGRILLAPDILIGYFPRASARALWRQYFNFGRGRARMLLLHRQKPKPRQLAPAIVAPAVLLALATPLTPIAALPALIWLTACAAFGAFLGIKARSLCAAFAGAPAAIMHLAWSAGFCAHLLAHVSAASRREAVSQRGA